MGSCLCCVVILLILISICEGCLREERRALLLIKESVNKLNGSALPDWEGDDCCSWGGVTCDESSPPQVSGIMIANRGKEKQGGWYPNATLFAQFKALEEIDLSETQFRGWIMPQGLNQMKRLQNLIMRDNQLTDASWIKNLTSLTYIDLSNNELVATSFFSGLGDLRVLNLSSNKLTDDVATWMYNLTSLAEIYLSNNMLREAPWIYNSTNLQYIDLSRNQLYDSSIITGICEMQSLEYLDIGQNKIQGSVPPCLGNLSSIRHIDLSKNIFSGVMSFSMLANLSFLSVLQLSSNHKLQVETESPSWSPSFQLYWLYLGNCIINKHSGGRIPSFLSSQRGLRRLDLANSSLMGEIPAFLIYNNSLDALRLKQNELAGSFPIPHRNVTSNLRFFDISRNNINRSLFGDVGSNFPKLRHLNMSANSLQGMISPSLGNMATLWVLDLSYNSLSGEIPNMLTSNTSLIFLILSNNKLHGKILPESSNMPRLEMLDLHDNLFTGVIPQDLLNSSSLKLLDVRGNTLRGDVPNWLHKLKELIALFLGTNSFQGPIPVELCQLQELHILDLSDNLLSGTIPPCLNGITSLKEMFPVVLRIPEEGSSTFERSSISFKFTTKGISYSFEGTPFSLMTGIDLSKNRLSGNIPDEIGDLAELRCLNLSNNLLTGPFPPSFHKLRMLESLDLSHNELVGAIPPGIVKLTYLSVFSVAYNNLSGCIPNTNQFNTFNNAIIYEGNPELRGDILGRSCSDVDGSSQSHTKEEEEEDVRIIDRDWIYHLFIGVSYAIGVWVVFIILIFNNKWRKAYFDVIDSYLDACVWRIAKYFTPRNKVSL